MATLAPGEKARMYALGKIARGGATRGGYVSAAVFVAIGGLHVGFGGTPGAAHVGTIIDSLSITDALNEAPNTCRFRINGLVPAAGGAVAVSLGSKNGRLLFAGLALHVDQLYAAERPANLQADVAAVDWTWLLGFSKATGRYVNQSATAIAKDLITRYAAANGFTTYNVAPDLPRLDVITFTNEELDQALTRLAKRIGAYWYVDYRKDLHLFFEEVLNGPPEVLTATHKSLAHVRNSADRTQVLTRVYVEGRGSSLLGAVRAGETRIPVEAVEMFTPAADVFAKISAHGSDGGAQHVTFTGVVPGAAGSLVGPGVGPPGAPALAVAAATGLGIGRYSYAYTDVTAIGETLPSPLAAIDVGALVAQPSTPIGLAWQDLAGALTLGYHEWAYSYVTAGGETPIGGGVGAENKTTLAPTGGISSMGALSGGALLPNKYYGYRVTYVGDAGGETTAAAFGKSGFTGPNGSFQVVAGEAGQGSGPHIPEGTAQVKFYRTIGGDAASSSAGPFYYVATVTPTRSPVYGLQAQLVDGAPDAALGAPIPTSSSALAKVGTVRLSTPSSGSPIVTGARLYRTKAGVSGVYQLIAQVSGAGGAVTYDDALADASLGAGPPPANSAGAEYRAVTVSNIAPGPPSTTGRKVYRSAANGATLGLVAVLGDNATTTWLDQVADASRGAAPPASDTSGLQQIAGQVAAGAASIVVANVAPFEAAGGWAVIGNGEQVIRYTGKTANALTGIPPNGIGAIVAGVSYSSTITAAPMLIGIPASGPYAIAEARQAGDEINLVVRREDGARQTALAAMIQTGPGWREEWIQDRRLAIPEARARGDATLARRPLEEMTITYTCRDLRTAAGKTITVNLPAPTNLAGTLMIQTVTIANFRPFPTQYPTFSVTASSNRFSFEDWLRRMEMKV